MKNHLHTYLALEKKGAVQLALDIPANVYLMTDAEYRNYLADSEFKAVGGYVRARSKTLKAPQAGNWHLVIDSKHPGETVNVSMQIIEGRAIDDDWQEQDEPERSPRRRKASAETEEAESGLSEEELAAKRKELIKDLTKMIKKIDTEGLLFLMKQASVIIHNQEVEALNRKLTDYNQTLSTQPQKGGKRKQRGAQPVDRALVDITENSENSFILTLAGVRKSFSRHELRQLLRICHAPVDDIEGTARLYKWFKDKRTDVLFDTGIRQSAHPALQAMRHFLRSRYKARED